MNATAASPDAGSPAFQALLQRLVAQHGFAPLGETDFDAWAAAPGHAVVLFLEDPVRYPECWDMAVVLPELLKSLPGRLRAGLLAPQQARALQPRFGFKRWPAAVFLQDGGYVGAIEGMLDWQPFLQEMRAMLARPVSRAPSIGIAVKAADAPSCH